MATKFTRDSIRHPRPSFRGPSGPAAPRRHMTPRNRLIVIQLVTLALIVLFLSIQRGQHGNRRQRPTTTVEGTIVSKELLTLETAGTMYMVEVSFAPNGGAMLTKPVATDPDSWSRVKVGDEVAVVYRSAASGDDVVLKGLYRLPTDTGAESDMPAPGPAHPQGTTQEPAD